MEKILILAPHTDDETIGCGGTISRFLREGKEVDVCAFSDCGIEAIEFEFKTANIGTLVPTINDFDVRTFGYNRQDILDWMIKYESGSDTIMIPSTYDFHQDHQTITNEAIRAFKNRTILGYELPWNNLESKNQCVIELTKQDVDNKVKAIKAYKSQAHRKYFDEDFIRSWARMRGVSNGCEYAEVFEVIKLRI